MLRIKSDEHVYQEDMDDKHSVNQSLVRRINGIHTKEYQTKRRVYSLSYLYIR